MGGHQPAGGGTNFRHGHFFAKTYVKIKEMGHVWGRSVVVPPESANARGGGPNNFSPPP